MVRLLVLALLTLALVVSPASAKKPRKSGKFRKVGKASYYAKDLHGQHTTSGERHDRDDLTAAHPALPLGTWCRVTNLRNGKTVTVKINDRCSSRGGRVIDLSLEAMKRLGGVRQGVIGVGIEVVAPKAKGKPKAKK